MNSSWKTTALVCGMVVLSFMIEATAQDPNFHIYLCFGQSNMCGAGSIETQDKTVDNRFQMMEPIGCTNRSRTFGKWYPATPPLWGCNGGLGPADYFGRTMVEKLPTNIRVGVIVVAVPGCDIRLFDKKDFKGYDTYNYVPAKYSGSAYAWLMELAKLAQKDGVIKGFLMHQGETMPDRNKWPGQVKAVHDSLIAELQLSASTTPFLAGELLYKDQGGTCGDNNTTIATLPNVILNTYVISAQGLAGKDQFHFTTESNRTIGKRYGDKMLSLYETAIMQGSESFLPSGMRGFLKNRSIVAIEHGTRISLQGEYTYRIYNINGAQVDVGRGNGQQSVGLGLGSGMYLLSVEHATGCFSGMLVNRQVRK